MGLVLGICNVCGAEVEQGADGVVACPLCRVPYHLPDPEPRQPRRDAQDPAGPRRGVESKRG